MKKNILYLTACLISISACNYDVGEKLYPKATTCDTTNVTFKNTIQPILANSCVSCHNSSFTQGNVNLDGYTNVAIWAKNGKLYGSMAHNGTASPMPKGTGKLDDCTIQKVKKWVDSGYPNN
ncbi:MAG: hypothetical protein ACOVQA_11930 [Thermoflexibacteraceae bacterium]|jgi:hypothetical protein